jgi:hypothetical protein
LQQARPKSQQTVESQNAIVLWLEIIMSAASSTGNFTTWWEVSERRILLVPKVSLVFGKIDTGSRE